MKRLGIILMLILSLTSCYWAEPKTGAFAMSKAECINRIKDLLDTDSIYLFDCDFTDLKDLEVEDISYNIYVSGEVLVDKNESDFIDLSKHCEVELVTNYKIKSMDTCFGVSIISKVLEGAHNSYKTGAAEFKPAKIYKENTFKSVRELYHQGFGNYEYNPDKERINVDSKFYGEVFNKSDGVYMEYFTIDGVYDLVQGINIIDTPLDIVCHYPNMTRYLETSDSRFTPKIIDDYFYRCGKYIKL